MDQRHHADRVRAAPRQRLTGADTERGQRVCEPVGRRPPPRRRSAIVGPVPGAVLDDRRLGPAGPRTDSRCPPWAGCTTGGDPCDRAAMCEPGGRARRLVIHRLPQVVRPLPTPDPADRDLAAVPQRRLHADRHRQHAGSWVWVAKERYGIGLLVVLVLVACHALGGLLMANDRKLGYWLALVAAFSPFVLRWWALRGLGYSTMDVITGGSTIGFIFDVALVALLLHPTISGAPDASGTSDRHGEDHRWHRGHQEAGRRAPRLQRLPGDHPGSGQPVRRRDRATTSGSTSTSSRPRPGRSAGRSPTAT